VCREYGIECEANAKQMTMNYERRNAVNRARELLTDMLWEKYFVRESNPELWDEARACLKHYPGEYDMKQAAEQSPEIFGEWEYYQRKDDEDV